MTHLETEVSPGSAPPAPITDLTGAFDIVERLRARLRRAVRGRDDVIEAVIIALLADGHILLEDYPGSGKTTLAKALGACIRPEARPDGIVAMRRIQFTPDLLPADVTGTTIFDPQSNRFIFRPGPIFAHVLLADEINRTSPKVQAALLEGMGEKQVTVDNHTRPLDELFIVIATQNPLDFAGTFPLPNAQLDRFLFKVKMVHIDRDAELEVLASIRTRRSDANLDDLPLVSRSEVIQARAVIEEQVWMAPEVRSCLVDIAETTRNDPRILLGLSTRALVLMIPALQACALTQHRNYVVAEDVRALARYAFAHRLELAPGAADPDHLVQELIAGPLETLTRASMRR